uniref:Cytochrome c oxidase subunit 3 n=1 Tax=Philometroides sanguineus TaxID=378106 RepID=A0A0U1XDI8_9BILA|nr:cytochrome c oxidase subunit III [Philometroides sanguineus]AIN37106.1 cytochrome c oxidase sununit III [Philometroides sanguineus]
MFHNYHLLGFSYYPLGSFFIVSSLGSSLVIWMKYGLLLGVFLSVISLIVLVMIWNKDIFMEGLTGSHNFYVMKGFKYGLVLFVFSELMFFFGIFWVFFDSSLVISCEMGSIWTPYGLVSVNPFGVPLLNTMILLSSAVMVTSCHNSILSSENGVLSLYMTCFLGILFLGVQFKEYCDSSFGMSDGIYGSVFYMSTGFHGLHVMLGTLFLLLNLYRLYFLHFNCDHHLSLKFSIIYWHFVDVVWLFLYVFIYCWSF